MTTITYEVSCTLVADTHYTSTTVPFRTHVGGWPPPFSSVTTTKTTGRFASVYNRLTPVIRDTPPACTNERYP